MVVASHREGGKKRERSRDETKLTQDAELRGEEREEVRGKVTDILWLQERTWGEKMKKRGEKKQLRSEIEIGTGEGD